MVLVRTSESDVPGVIQFLRDVDLTLSGVDSTDVTLWIERDASGSLIGATGCELSTDGRHALIRSVAVRPDLRGTGYGSRLAAFAVDRARLAGAERAWLFSRRSGPFWQKLGFQPADPHELATALANTYQVQLFTESGQLEREIAWSRSLIETPG